MAHFSFFSSTLSHHFLCECQRKTLRRILKGPCKLLARSMCAMGHSHTRFIPLVVLIMSAFYLLCKARSTEACNKPAFPIINLQDGIGGFRTSCQVFSILCVSFTFLLLTLSFFNQDFFSHHILHLTTFPRGSLSTSFLDVNFYIDKIIKHFYLEIYKLIGYISLKLTRLVDPSKRLPELI